MDDYISRQSAIDWLNSEWDGIVISVFKGIESLPSAQPEIIRCKDCKYASPNGLYGCLLERFSAHDQSERLFAEDYCSAAERKEDA